jgi:predicted DNA-binding protein (MmcQ/YjbR family)
MHIEAFYDFCTSLPGTSEDFPFDENTLVFKVMGKMYALIDVEKFESINLKCDPIRALELRTGYEEIKPGYHMNKKHWNTVSTNGNLSDEFIYDLIKHSYEIVVAKLPQKSRDALASL